MSTTRGDLHRPLFGVVSRSSCRRHEYYTYFIMACRALDDDNDSGDVVVAPRRTGACVVRRL